MEATGRRASGRHLSGEAVAEVFSVRHRNWRLRVRDTLGLGEAAALGRAACRGAEEGPHHHRSAADGTADLIA